MWEIRAAALLLGLLGAREIVRGIRYSQLSGFRFYLVNGLVEGLSYLLALPLIFVIPNYSVGIIVGAILLSTVPGFWTDQQESKVIRANPPEWQEWNDLRKQASTWDIFTLLIFFDGSKKTP